MGIDVVATLPGIAAANGEGLASHNLLTASPSTTPVQVFDSRGVAFAVMVFDISSPDWSLEKAFAAVQKQTAAKRRTFVYLVAKKPPVEHSAIAYRLTEAKPAAIIFAGDFAPGGMELVNNVFIFFGLGSLGFSTGPELRFPVTFVTRFTYYGDRLMTLDLTPVRRQGSKLAPLFGEELKEAYAGFFVPPHAQVNHSAE